jgi:hypothetical protein
MRPLLLLVCLSAAAARADSPPEIGAATAALSELQTACRHDQGALWGVPLCGPIVLFDARTRAAVASEPDPAGTFTRQGPVWTGAVPADFAAATTARSWGGREWATVVLPLSQDPYLRLKLLVHESFHRVQGQLGFHSGDVMNAHLDQEAGRLWLRLELRALAQALRASGSASRPHIEDALLFRRCRYALFPGAEQREAALELREGVPEYTGAVIALKETGETVERVARQVESFEDNTSYGRSFAYATGPALGLLLDRWHPKWRAEVARAETLSGLLERSLGFHAPKAVEQTARQWALRYGFPAVARAERDRQADTEAIAAHHRAALVSGPVLTFPATAELYRTFNPNNLVSLGESGTVYPTGTFTSRWGKLEVDGTGAGALLAPDNQLVRVPAPGNPDARPLEGPGWRLELAPEWTVRPGARPGDYEVVPKP